MPKAIAVGDRVKFSARYCKDTCQVTGSIPHARGMVTNLRPLGHGVVLATISWGFMTGDDVPNVVNVANLAHDKDPEHGSV